jgi:hypothetical protein
MPTVMLASKIHGNYHHLKLVEEYVKSSLQGLKVKIENVEATPNKWLQLTFSGEDEKAALSYLEKEVGLCPVNIKSLQKFSMIRGYITSLGESRDEIHADIGVTFPKAVVATVPLQRLQSQLADGRKIAIHKIVELYGFSENAPITIKITSLSENRIEAEMAEVQLATYKRWVKSLLDRLIVIGASQQEIRKALKYSKCQNDIVAIEPLGLFEYAVVCKLGTDAVGLIPKVGKHLPNTKLATFNPRTLRKFFEGLYIT